MTKPRELPEAFKIIKPFFEENGIFIKPYPGWAAHSIMTSEQVDQSCLYYITGMGPDTYRGTGTLSIEGTKIETWCGHTFDLHDPASLKDLIRCLHWGHGTTYPGGS